MKKVKVKKVQTKQKNENIERGKKSKKRQKKKLKSEIGIRTSSRIEGIDPPRVVFHIKCHAFDKCGSTYQSNLQVDENSNLILT